MPKADPRYDFDHLFGDYVAYNETRMARVRLELLHEPQAPRVTFYTNTTGAYLIAYARDFDDAQDAFDAGVAWVEAGMLPVQTEQETAYALA